jgi:RNA polymerase sigma factor for flagellar operon FliA
MTVAAQVAYRSSKQDIDQRNALVMAELPKVYYIAAKIRERLPQQIELEDLVHAGVIGLIEACQKFDIAKEVGFSTFAKFRIRGAILDSLRKLDWGSRAIRKKGRAIAASTSSLAVTFGRQPLQEEIAEHLKIELVELQSTLTELDGLNLVNQQFDAANDVESAYDLIESAVSRGKDNPFEACLEGEARDHLRNSLSQLTKREQLIISLYYQEEMTMREIAEIVGIAISRVSQIHASALATLRASLRHLSEAATHKDIKGPAAQVRLHPLRVQPGQATARLRA